MHGLEDSHLCLRALCPVFVSGITEQGDHCTEKRVLALCFLLLFHINAAAGGSQRSTVMVTKVTAAMMKRHWCEAVGKTGILNSKYKFLN